MRPSGRMTGYTHDVLHQTHERSHALLHTSPESVSTRTEAVTMFLRQLNKEYLLVCWKHHQRAASTPSYTRPTRCHLQGSITSRNAPADPRKHGNVNVGTASAPDCQRSIKTPSTSGGNMMM